MTDQPAAPSPETADARAGEAPAANPRTADAPAAVAITGANRGVGLAAAQEVARAGHPVVLLCRSERRGRDAAETLAPPSGPGAHHVVPIDLASLDSVRRAAQAVADLGRPLAALVNNAAVLPAERTESRDGFELQLAVNHLAHFLLSGLLFPLLDRSVGPARVISVSSGAHHGPAFDFDDPNFRRKPYGPREAYQQSKLANVLFANGLASRSNGASSRSRVAPSGAPRPASAPRPATLPSVQSLALGPGVYHTELLKDYLGGESTSSAPFPVADSAVAGPIVADLAIGRPNDDLNGGYFDRGTPAVPSPAALNEHDQERLWSWSASVTGAPQIRASP